MKSPSVDDLEESGGALDEFRSDGPMGGLLQFKEWVHSFDPAEYCQSLINSKRKQQQQHQQSSKLEGESLMKLNTVDIDEQCNKLVRRHRYCVYNPAVQYTLHISHYCLIYFIPYLFPTCYHAFIVPVHGKAPQRPHELESPVNISERQSMFICKITQFLLWQHVCICYYNIMFICMYIHTYMSTYLNAGYRCVSESGC